MLRREGVLGKAIQDKAILKAEIKIVLQGAESTFEVLAGCVEPGLLRERASCNGMFVRSILF